MDDSYLPDTQTQEECSQNTQEPTIRTPWGRLSACLPSLLSVDLFESSYTCGRAAYCNIVIEKSQFPCFLNVSKEHFAITKEEDMVYITDLSKNGTFVNSRRVGRHNRNVIQTNDIIALGQPNTRAFIFNCNLNGDDFLPQELKKTYFVSRLLGQGACGEVRFAIHKQTLEKYAIKKIVKGRSSSNLANLNHPKKIQTEIEILKKISHPFIIQMREVLETEKEVFLVLEFMEGGDLSGLIQSLIPLSESQVKFIFYQMLLAIQYLHQHGVTHRDLKPENVLLTGGTTPLIKISDFGLSKMMNEISLMQTMCGTINYAAPEILNPGGTYSRKVDVWSLGVILF
ncbi:serine/threonine-protein kinase Chk2, partial [Asbolus verrucosus]